MAIIIVFLMFLPEVFRVGITSNEWTGRGTLPLRIVPSNSSVAVEMENGRFPVVAGSGNVVASCFLNGIY